MRTPLGMIVAGLVSAAALGSSLVASVARADEVQGTRSDKMIEQAHWISLRLHRGHARAVVRRTVHNGGSRHDQAVMWLHLPEEAVAVDLRTLSEKDGQPIWYRGELMEAEAAAAKYRELTGIGGYYPKDPALLSWRHPGLLALQVFPVPPRQPKTVEYTLELPMTYSGGRYHLVLPRMGTARLAARAELHAAEAGDRVFVDGKLAGPGGGVTLSKDETKIDLAPSKVDRLDGALASVRFGPSRVLSHFQVNAAPRISETPRGAAVVVIIDASRSFDDGVRTAGIAALRATLSHFADARVEVLTFDRAVRAELGGFMPVSRARSALGKLAITPRNGSHFDDALARADALLARLPRETPKRILAITDLHTRSSLTPERVAALKSGALLHVGVIDAGYSEPSVTRDDASPWARVTRPTGGLVWNAIASVEAGHTAALARAYEEWARPVRIDGFKIDAKGIGDGLYSVPGSLAEGEGFEDRRIGDAEVTDVSIEGELWATPIRKTMKPDEAAGRLWSALAFGAYDLRGSLNEQEMMVLAMRGHAVSPVTSLLAIEPGVRPSTEGLEVSGFGSSGGGMGSGIGLGSIGTIGHGRGSFDPDRWLRDALSAGLANCGGAGKKTKVALESTRNEVVDVTLVSVDGGSDAVVRCVREAVWGFELPGAFTAAWQAWTVSV